MSSVFSTGSIVATTANGSIGPITVPAGSATLDSTTMIIVHLMHVGTTSEDLTPASFTNGFQLIPGSGKYSTQGSVRTWVGLAYKRGDGGTNGTTVTWNAAGTANQAVAVAYKTAKEAAPFQTPTVVATDALANTMTVPSSTTEEDDSIVAIWAATDINWGGTGISANNGFSLAVSGGSGNRAALLRRTVALAGTSVGATTLSWTAATRAAAVGVVLKTGTVNTPPTLSVTAPQDLTAGSTFHVALTAADVDAGDSIASYSTTAVPSKSTASQSLSGADTDHVSGVVGVPGSIVTLASVVTDSLGSSSPVRETEIRSLKSGAINPVALPTVTTDGSTWTRVGSSATTDGELLAASTASASAYLESPAAGATPQSRRIRLEPSVPITGGTIRTWISKSTADPVTVIPKLYEGATLRYTWPALTVSTTMNAVDVVINAGTASTLGSTGDWSIQYEVSA